MAMSEFVHPEPDPVEAWAHHVIDTADLHDTLDSDLPITDVARQQRIKGLVGLDVDTERLAAPDQLLSARRVYQESPVAFIWASPATWDVNPKFENITWHDYGTGVTLRPGRLEIWFGDLPAGSQSLVTIKLKASPAATGGTGIVAISSSGGSPPTTLRVQGFREHIVDIVMRLDRPGSVLAVLETKEGLGSLYFQTASLIRVS